MYTHILDVPYVETLPLLDEEFDTAEFATDLTESTFLESTSGDEIAWDDQLDSGHDVTL